jgi:hypothetical protein
MSDLLITGGLAAIALLLMAIWLALNRIADALEKSLTKGDK